MCVLKCIGDELYSSKDRIDISQNPKDALFKKSPSNFIDLILFSDLFGGVFLKVFFLFLKFKSLIWIIFIACRNCQGMFRRLIMIPQFSILLIEKNSAHLWRIFIALFKVFDIKPADLCVILGH